MSELYKPLEVPSHAQEAEEQEAAFDRKKSRFFVQLGLRLREKLTLHKSAGLWAKDERGNTWENVSQHCLVEAARVEVLAEQLGFSDGLKESLIEGAVLHDFYKAVEISRVKAEGMKRSNFEKVEAEASELLRQEGIDEEVIRLVNSIGAFNEVEDILLNEQRTPEDSAFLVMEYVDSYTVNAEWVHPVIEAQDGKRNDLDRRVDMNEGKEVNKYLNEEGREVFDGKTTFEMQRSTGHGVERLLSALLKESTGEEIDPLDIPLWVDNKIREKIAER